jgi:hypothetical protein
MILAHLQQAVKDCDSLLLDGQPVANHASNLSKPPVNVKPNAK